MSVRQEPTKAQPSHDAKIQFWVVAVLGIPAAVVAWTWYGFSFSEAQTEQGKALAAGSTMAGFAEVVGGIPLILAHTFGLVALLMLGWKGFRWPGVAVAIVAVLISSAIGIGVGQLLFKGQLFHLGINNDTYVP
jgi:hypothetical protein